MTVKTIVTDWLKANGYDGLCYPEHECGCTVEDLMSCGEISQNCEAAFKGPGDADFDYLMYPEYPGERDGAENG